MDQRIVPFLACLLAAAYLHKVIVKQGAALGLSHAKVGVLGAAAGVLVSKVA